MAALILTDFGFEGGTFGVFLIDALQEASKPAEKAILDSEPGVANNYYGSGKVIKLLDLGIVGYKYLNTQAVGNKV